MALVLRVLFKKGVLSYIKKGQFSTGHYNCQHMHSYLQSNMVLGFSPVSIVILCFIFNLWHLFAFYFLPNLRLDVICDLESRDLTPLAKFYCKPYSKWFLCETVSVLCLLLPYCYLLFSIVLSFVWFCLLLFMLPPCPGLPCKRGFQTK